MSAQPAPDLIPVTLLTGFLGSGKTTLLNHLVHQPEMADTLVIINEFGEMGLDHMLVAHSSEDQVIEMSSGCLCCTIRGDLVKTLRDITWRFSIRGKRLFQRVVIETTGLADPAPIIQTLITHPSIVAHYRLDGIVTNVDMATGLGTLDQHREAARQAAVSDVLLLTKPDLASEETRAALEQRLDSINPAATRWVVDHGEVAPDKLLNLGLFTSGGKSPDIARWLAEDAYAAPSHDEHNHDGHDHHHDINRHDEHIRAFCFSLDEPVTEQAFSAWQDKLTQLAGSQILRMKGILHISGSERPMVVHGVQHVFHPPVALPAWPTEDRRSRLVFITRDLGRDVIEKTLQVLSRDNPPLKQLAD